MLPVAGLLDAGEAVIRVHMTGTGAIAQLADRVKNGRRILGLFVWPLFVVIRMTGCTIGAIGRRSPGRHLAVAAMAIHTAHIGTVIPRITGGDVPIICRYPGLRGVTVIALLGGNEVIIVFADGRYAVMTAVTNGIGDTVVKGRRHPGAGAVTGIAFRRGLHMVAGLARSGHAIVATATGTRDAVVIKAGG